MYYVYALFSEGYNRVYIGLTSKVDRRVEEHNSGEVKSKQYYLPWTLFYVEEFPTRFQARSREKKLKTSFGRKYLREILNNKRL